MSQKIAETIRHVAKNLKDMLQYCIFVTCLCDLATCPKESQKMHFCDMSHAHGRTEQHNNLGTCYTIYPDTLTTLGSLYTLKGLVKQRCSQGATRESGSLPSELMLR